jgi:protein TonB
VVARIAFLGSSSQRFMAGSLVVHALLVAALILLPAFRKKQHFPENALIVELAPLMRSAPPAAKPKPKVQTPPPAPKPEEGVRIEAKEPVKKPEPPAEEPKPQPAQEQAAPEEEELTDGGAPELLGGPDAGHSISPMEGGDVEFAWYRASVTAALYSNWRRPILSGITEPLEVSVGFEILRDGRVVNLRIENPSGVPSLDRSALRALADASPLPPLPAQWREPRLTAVFVFRMYPEGF